MATEDELPSHYIKRILLDRPEACLDVGAELLRGFSDSLGKTIGEDGFRSLLFRAARRVAVTHPWLRLDPPAGQAVAQQDWFGQCFEGRADRDIEDAMIRLLTGLVDILTDLIGARLTTIILNNAAAGVSASNNGKERHNG